jgi:hypothetical protein
MNCAASTQREPTITPIRTESPLALTVPRAHSNWEELLNRTTRGSDVRALEMLMAITKMLNARLKAPNADAPRLRAIRILRARFVRLEKT